jgi:DUF4097 and DUF4098 domain-containing protein YvlB
METMTDDVVDQVYQVSTPAELSLNTISGQATVRATETDEIRVRATKGGSDRARGNTRIDVQREGNRVSIHTRADSSLFGGAGHLGRNMASVEYDITVPRDCAVEIKAVSADITLEGTRSQCRLQTVSGDVHIEDIEGASSVTTVSGDVAATGLRGTLTLHTTSGDARVAESNLRDFNLHSVSGDFEVATPLMHGEHYHANTVSGDLRLTVPEGTGVTVQMRSISGEVVSDFRDAEIIKSGRRHWQGRINGGGANVEMQSVSGDLRIARGSAGDSTPPTQEYPGERRSVEIQSDAEAAGVLSLLEQGEIDVDEALSRLKSLER